MSSPRILVLLSLFVTACTSSPPPAPSAADNGEVAQALIEQAARDCPWPADVAQYAQTTLIVRHQGARAPELEIVRQARRGCAVLSFSLDSSGIVRNSRALVESPAGFGAVAQKVLAWNDYATGISEDTLFMVRLAAQSLPGGDVLVSLGFHDNVINIVIPASVGR